VSTWPIPAIAGFAAKAGIPTRDLAAVTALALAATGGRDHYFYEDPWQLGSARWGLWALPAPEGLTAPSALYDPQFNARLLVGLARTSQGYDWGRHESFGPTGHLIYVDHVSAVLAAHRPGEKTGVDGSFHDQLAAMVGRARATAQRFGGT